MNQNIIIYIQENAFNTLRPRQTRCHFTDDIFKSLNENWCNLIEISLKFVPNVPLNNKSILVQIMAWRQTSNKSLYEPVMVSLLTHICVTLSQWVKNLVNEMSAILFRPQCINSSPLSAAYMRQWIGSAFVQIMACCLFGTKPLSKAMLGYCQLDP